MIQNKQLEEWYDEGQKKRKEEMKESKDFVKTLNFKKDMRTLSKFNREIGKTQALQELVKRINEAKVKANVNKENGFTLIANFIQVDELYKIIKDIMNDNAK
ncbi:MAG: hypothetical protein M0R80_17590 [Proteobacteria bacterium]|jgi:ribosomal protein S18|nr:hypothetical protein [Pseudomonadota bacterium]